MTNTLNQKPVDPIKPEEPKKPELPNTGFQTISTITSLGLLTSGLYLVLKAKKER